MTFNNLLNELLLVLFNYFDVCLYVRATHHIFILENISNVVYSFEFLGHGPAVLQSLYRLIEK